MRLPNTTIGAEIIASGQDVKLKADVLVIGSGCGGATLAKLVAEAGHSVVILEQGGLYSREELDQRELHSLAKIDGGRGLDTSANQSVQLTYGNCVGGASVHYWADSYRLPADRLELWESRYGMSGHSMDELTPIFERIEAEHHVHPASDFHVNRMNALLREAAEKLGWQADRVPQARNGCARSGYCHQGCSYDAKQSQLVTSIPRALSLGAQLYADCRASLLVWEGSRVKGVKAQVLDRATGRASGRVVEVEASAVVVAAGGYGTPSFLLTQGLREHLPNLGEHLFVNPCPMTHGVFDEDIEQWRNIPASWGLTQFRLASHTPDPDAAPTGFFGRQGRYVEGGYLLMANQLQPALLAAALPGDGAAHRALMRKARRLGGLIAWIDDAEEGRISWDGAQRRVNVPLDGGNAPRIRDAFARQARLLFAAGAREVLFGDVNDTRVTDPSQVDAAVAALSLRPGHNLFAAPHPGGAARMGADPLRGVVGFDHRVLETDNLFVADSSVFPTGPSVDPSLTIMAFSHIAARHVLAGL